MIQGILIQAHKNFEQLYHLVEYFSNDCYVFIHLDKKFSLSDEQVLQLKSMPQVKGVYREFSIHWAGFSILKCELFLLKKAMEYSEIGYFHLISAQDYPIKPLKVFLDFFSNTDKEYLDFGHIPNPRFDHNTYWRFDYFFLFDFISRTKKAQRKNDKFVDIQKKLGIKRSIPRYFEHLYGGSAWFSITRYAVSILLDYTLHHPAFYRRLRFAFCSEETYVLTILLNLLSQSRIVNDNKRIVIWSNINGSYPANLGAEHIHILHESNAFFARKFEYPISKKLIDYIDQYLINDTTFERMSTGAWNYNGLIKYKYNEKIISIIYDCYKVSNSTSLIDLGCGAGNYVASLRRLNIPAVGYDANPYTPILSECILGDNNRVCEVADLTDNLAVDIPFDTTICIDVLQDIPDELKPIAIHNLCMLTKKVLILKYNGNFDVLYPLFQDMGMRLNILMTNKANETVGELYILETA